MKTWIILLTISLGLVGCGSNYEDTSGLISSAQEQIDQNSNEVTLDTLVDINASNVSSYSLSGTCSPDSLNIDISVGGASQSVSCSAGLWGVTGWDLSAVADDAAVAVAVDLKDVDDSVLISASGSLVKDVIAPALTMVAALDIDPSNVATYSLSGTCDEEGGVVSVVLGGSSSSTSCSAGAWAISNWDVSAEADGVGIAVTADLSDAAGNAATSVSDSVDKDAIAPLVEITAPATANYINISTDSATFAVSGTCNKNSEIVEIKVDGVSATSQVGFVCDGTSFSGTIDSTGISDAAIVVTAEMVYNAQTATSSNINLIKDTVAPTVGLDAIINISSANVAAYSLSGTCDDEGSSVSIVLGILSNSASCSSGTWSVTNWDVAAESDALAIAVTADLTDAAGNPAVQATGTVDKDATAPVVAISSPLDATYINIASDSAAFAVSGTCNKNGETVDVKIDGVSAASQVGFVCDGTNFSGTVDTTGISDAAIVMTAELTKDAVTGTSSDVNITKDTIAPSLVVTAPAIINIANVTSYYLSGTCDEDGSVSVDIGGVTATGTCSANAWTISAIDASAASDNASLSILADMDDLAGNPAIQQSESALKDTVAPTLAVTSAPDVNGSNHTAYTLIGTCSEDGQTVTVDIGGLSYTPTCSGGSFTTGSVDISSLVDNASIAVTADMDDAAGNPAVQAVDSIAKDVAVPTVTIDVAPDISQANLTSYVASGTCSENGRAVVVNIGSINVNPNCSSGTWSSGFVDATSLTDGVITITADHDNIDLTPAVQATVDVNKDVSAPTVTISSAPSITSANELTYIASGTCSESTRTVVVYIDTLNFNPTCSATKTWTTGFVDVSSIPDGTGISVTADHDNASLDPAVQATASTNKATSTPTVAGLSVSSTLTTSADIAWNLNDPGGFTINDYVVNYRVKGTSTWLNFVDGVSVAKNATVDSLTASTTYEFRIAVQYDTTEQSAWSNTAEGETQPDSPVFGANKAMNVGGATSSTVVAYQDSTSVTLNGVALTTLNKGQTHTFTSTIFDVIDADKPIYTAGRRGSGGDTSKGNMVWSPTSWAGKAFSFNTIRYNPQKLEVFAIENTYVEIKQGSTIVASATISANTGSTLTWSVYGSFQVVSTGSILAFHYSNASGAIVDPKPILPSAYEIIGIPSRSMRLTSDLDGTNYNGLHGDSTAFSGSLSKTSVVSINGRGTGSYYQEVAMLISADKKISGAAFADANGGCATPFMPTNLMKKKYAVNVAATYVAFASKQAGTIQVLDSSDTVVQTLTLTRSGANPNTPYKVRRGATTAGYRFVATVPVFAVYEPSGDTGGADNDETIMYGTDE